MKHNRWFCLFFMLLVFCACSTSPTPLATAEPNVTTQAFSPIDAAKISEIKEVNVLSLNEQHGSLFAIRYLTKKNQILAAYQDGALIALNMNSEMPTHNFSLGTVKKAALAFSRSGNLLIGATQQYTTSTDIGLPVAYLNNIKLWNINTGNVVTCITASCEEDTPTDSEGWIGAIFGQDEKSVLLFDESAITIIDLYNNNSKIYLVNSPDSRYWWHIGQLAYDYAEDRVAIVYKEGRIELLGTSNNSGSFSASSILSDGAEGDIVDVTTAKIDPTGAWLAFVRENHVLVWKISPNKKLFLDLAVDNVISLEYDQSGKLLFIVTTDKILVRDLISDSLVTEIITPGITTMAISDDNRLLIWGDQKGQIHVYGIWKSQ
jgi:WD40 repeat protein